ncbi:MAG TPA: response regulator [Aggregatilinea sp.]|uniref:response regulator n=1 Tax=Aggregatilinea sp. TaxID=2806333 RepID=UPI002B900FF3|nr:response regulator [Aggregatilinea sp.]HML22982.1 response regulator [Aggregatilinea sp.]
MTLQNTSEPASSPQEAYILVVEDSVPNFVTIARLLGLMGVNHCEWKISGWQVVQFAPTLPQIDLIIMDIDLPYEDGYQALRKLRSHPRLATTRVVALTATATQEEMIRARDAGFNGFLSKPLDGERFPSQIRRVLNGENVWEWR